MEDGARRLVVGRLRKPHGLKGDCGVFPLTDDPETVFVPGAVMWLVDLAGETVAGPLELGRVRGYHREWLVSFQGHGTRSAVAPYTGTFLAVPAGERPEPQGDEVYLDELEGFAVHDAGGRALGLVTGWYEMPAGLTLEVQGPRREFLMPFRKALVRKVDRPNRRLEVDLPEGLVDL